MHDPLVVHVQRTTAASRAYDHVHILIEINIAYKFVIMIVFDDFMSQTAITVVRSAPAALIGAICMHPFLVLFSTARVAQ